VKESGEVARLGDEGEDGGVVVFEVVEQEGGEVGVAETCVQCEVGEGRCGVWCVQHLV